MSTVAVVGLGKLGASFAAAMAAAGHRVHGIDPFNTAAVAAINNGRAPNSEPGLGRLMYGIPEGGLTASTDYRYVDECEASFIVVPTPSGPDGRFDSTAVRDAVERVDWLTSYSADHVIVVCSTLQPGTMDQLTLTYGVTRLAYAPQFIALGSVIEDLRHPDLVIIGADAQHVGARVEHLLSYLWHEETETIVAHRSLINAEIAKLAVNAYVTMKISFANTIAEACEHTPGADALQVLMAIGHDPRIAQPYLAPGGPYGGPCFPRDTVAISAWLDDCRMPAHLPAATKEVNDRQVRRIAKMLDRYETVGILGLSYKPGTAVTDGSLGLAVGTRLESEGSHKVVAHDPGIPRSLHGTAWYMSTPEEAIEAADAVLVATGHPEYLALDVKGKPTVDVWGILRPQPGVRTIGRWVLADG